MENKAVTSRPRIVKIVRFSYEKLWYKDFIGFEFVVESSTTRDFYVFYDGYLRGILCRDAVVIN